MVFSDLVDTGVKRGRGGFMRGSGDAPYVSDPAGVAVKSGKRKGELKRVKYGSPSGAGKLIESTFNLQRWAERMTVTGIGVDLALIAQCAQLVGMDRESDEYRNLADEIVEAAKLAAKAALAADRGTHAHSLTEDHDEDRDWVARAEAGEDLGLDIEAQQALVQAWQDMLDRYGIEILAVEASVVDDTWRLAGTLDRVARCTKALRFVLPSGEVRRVPAGTILIVDVKSGKRRLRSDGSTEYWQGYGIQIASYAQSVPYDTDTEARGAWEWDISQEHALIAHLDVLGALAGNPSCDLIYVDLVASREHGGACVQMAKEWDKRRDLFSTSCSLDADEQEPELEVAVSAESEQDARRIQLYARHDALSKRRQGEFAERSNGIDLSDLDAVEQLLDDIVNPPTIVASAQRRTAKDQQREADRRLADDGGPALPADIAEIEARWELALDDTGRRWLGEVVVEAEKFGCDFRLSALSSQRRADTYCALTEWAAIDRGRLTKNDTYLRAAIFVTAISVDHNLPGIWTAALGSVVGVLSPDEAAALRSLVTQIGAGAMSFVSDPDGISRWEPAANHQPDQEPRT